MSFYTRNSFKITSHTIVRAKERLGLENKTNFEIELYIINYLKKQYSFEFQDKKYYYFRILEKQNYYFVVSKKDNLVITVSKISDHKKILLIG